ncbi:hypothetical protein FA13DRAFT_1792030 [Coprinellus micaceus]|uniref:F-box domain-containing protein n=1 Tax=Coprinellus micaceus TaxID=71717 RepID=A0A4Y7TBF6_COPMI|nr:hypothetical protein FA13DRAFT_1792030 [Coprinellus micaceus]
MVSTRRQSGVTPKPSPALKRTLDSVGDGYSSEEDYEEPNKRKSSGRKRRKTTEELAKVKSKATAIPVRRKKDLSLLPTMPLDILRQLGPKDLLSLSRTDKLWRRAMVNPETVFFVERREEGLQSPEPPEDFTEHWWTGLLFETTCEGCGKKGTMTVDWLLLKRVCVGCKRNHLMYGPRFKSFFPGQDRDVLNYVPHTFSFIGTKFQVVHGALSQMKSLSGAELEEWKEDMTEDIEERARMVSTYTKWGKDMDKVARQDVEANREGRLKAATQRFVEAGYELIDIRKGLSLYSNGIYSGVPYIMNAVWTKIRPGLEIDVSIKRNQRLDEELRPAIKKRMSLLKKLYDAHLDRTARPSERLYSPPVGIFRPIPEVLKIIEADKDTIITAKDFDAIVSNFDKYLTEWQEEKKNSSKALVPSISSREEDEYPFSLARHIFMRSSSEARGYAWLYRENGAAEDDVLVGWPMVGTHWHEHPRRLQIRLGVDVPVPAGFAYNAEASEISSTLIGLAGLNPASVTVSDMDREDKRFVLGNFYTAIGYPVFNWRAATGIGHLLQRKYWGMRDCEFRLATARPKKRSGRDALGEGSDSAASASDSDSDS